MTNHIHLIANSINEDLSNTVRDLKKFTSRSIIEQIEKGIESRRECLPAEASAQAGMLDRFMFVAQRHSKNKKYQLWTHENHAVHLYSHKFMREKLEYLHNNPVRAGIVEKPEDYFYSISYCVLYRPDVKLGFI